MVETIFMVVSYALIVAAFVGWATFRVLYKPWRPAGHSAVGQHLIRTADSLIALFGVSLLNTVIHLPGPLMQVATVLILGWLAWVAWERVHLLRQEQARARAKRAAQRQEQARTRPTGASDDDPDITVP